MATDGYPANRDAIIFINAERNFLQDLSSIFGRYFISRTISAALQRASITEKRRKPANLYVDDAAAYFDQ